MDVYEVYFTNGNGVPSRPSELGKADAEVGLFGFGEVGYGLGDGDSGFGVGVVEVVDKGLTVSLLGRGKQVDLDIG